MFRLQLIWPPSVDTLVPSTSIQIYAPTSASLTSFSNHSELCFDLDFDGNSSDHLDLCSGLNFRNTFREHSYLNFNLDFCNTLDVHPDLRSDLVTFQYYQLGIMSQFYDLRTWFWNLIQSSFSFIVKLSGLWESIQVFLQIARCTFWSYGGSVGLVILGFLVSLHPCACLYNF